ncbi:uncharacterized protein [Lolium perenne]|uniref:uncharacterized protein n=1 Tax=Lolium perenne TaxID=4522 RepID=UPI0021F5014E|nr:uncharacterized protein LOC127337139 [Lolium perenne]
MSRSRDVAVAAVLLLLVLLAATATAAINPQAEAPQDDKPLDHLAHRLPLLKEEPAARIASTEPAARLESVRPADDGLPLKEEPAARLESVPPVDHAAQGVPLKEEPAARTASSEPAAGIALVEKKDGGGDAALPMEAARPTSGVAIQGGDPGTVPSAGSDNGGSASGEHGKEQGGGSSKEAEKSASAAKSCLTKEECHKKRLLCGKGCTMSAHAKCAAKCSKACIPTC